MLDFLWLFWLIFGKDGYILVTVSNNKILLPKLSPCMLQVCGLGKIVAQLLVILQPVLMFILVKIN